ncbi:alpha/beta fold hydrolase [Longimicrobium sp.]|uniref:alpha/beta fold hydrolase n=1 Tax=Longimicrobium sp. TaxID=2029185 RepID=UPI002D031EF6|nr:alpha/beta fold hydrolase [Longimicrobium sp.]HSU17615.1 alpha/beta fold hydrolase [Longimicrobium sp.]
MPNITVNGASLWYDEHGSGAETIVFAHGLLWDGRMFDAQVAALKHRYRCITFDFRGQGRSAVAAGGYDMDTLADDAAELIEKLGAKPCHFVGLSMGGFVGMRLAARRPELIRSLVLMETSAEPEPPESASRYRMLGAIVRVLGKMGMRMVMPRVMRIMFGGRFLDDPTREAERQLWRERGMANHRVGITRALRGVIDRKPVLAELDRIACPTLVMVGDEDVATVPEKAERIRGAIRGARLVIIPGAGHTSSVEEPLFVNRVLTEFLARMAASASA